MTCIGTLRLLFGLTGYLGGFFTVMPTKGGVKYFALAKIHMEVTRYIVGCSEIGRLCGLKFRFLTLEIS